MQTYPAQWRSFAFWTASIMVITFLGGCSTIYKIDDPERFEQVTGVDKHSSYPAIRRNNIETIHLRSLIDPEMKAKTEYPKSWEELEPKQNDSTAIPEDRKENRLLELTFAWFNNKNTQSAEQKRITRNSVQERIMIVSNQRCNVFKTYLRREQADTNFGLGAATTAAGVLGAVLPGVQASRNLAGTAGLFSGIQAEYNQNYFGNLVASVITQGIDVRREQTQARIRSEGQSKGIDEYSLEAAIRDAVYYDGLCSTLTGLEEAQASVQNTTNPGIERAIQTMTSIKAAYEISQGKLTDLEANGKLESLLKRTRINTSPLAASFIPSRETNANNVMLFQKARDSWPELLGQRDLIVRDITSSYKSLLGVLQNNLKNVDSEKKKLTNLKPPEDLGKDLESKIQTLFSGRSYLPGLSPDQTSCKEQTDAVEIEWTTAQLQLRNVDTNNAVATAAAKVKLELAQNKAQALLKKIDAMTQAIKKDLDLAADKWRDWMNSGEKSLWKADDKGVPSQINSDAINPPIVKSVISEGLTCRP